MPRSARAHDLGGLHLGVCQRRQERPQFVSRQDPIFAPLLATNLLHVGQEILGYVVAVFPIR